MRVLQCLVAWRLFTRLLSDFALFPDVGSSDTLKAKVVTHLLLALEFQLDDVPHPLQVELVGIHDGVPVPNVELVGQLLADGLDSALDVGLFCIDVQLHISLKRDLTDLDQSLSQLLIEQQVVAGDTSVTGQSDSLQQRGLLVLLGSEQVRVCVDFQARRRVCLVVSELQRSEQVVQLRFFKLHTVVHQACSKLFQGEGLLLVEPADFVHEDVLCPAQTRENVHAKQSCNLDGKVSLASALS